jgi:hypothetical protein
LRPVVKELHDFDRRDDLGLARCGCGFPAGATPERLNDRPGRAKLTVEATATPPRFGPPHERPDQPMNIPPTGIVLIPIGLLLVFMPWRYCLIGLMIFAMMSPAAVVNVGSLGLQPGYYMSLLLIGRTAVEIMFDRFRLNAYVLSLMRPLFYFATISFIVLFIALCFFQGRVETLPGAAAFKSNLAHSYHLGRDNFTQMAYLMLNICLVYVFGHQGARRPLPELLKDWDHAIVCGLCFSTAICLWQFTSFYAGLPFPSDFFYSNAGYHRADSQTMAGLLRINGPFEEPSTLGYIFTGYLMFAWLRYRLYPTAFSTALIAASIVCMLSSTSTTAYFGGFLFGCLVIHDVATQRLHLLTKDLRLSSSQFAAIAIIVVAVLGGAFVVARYWQSIDVILQATVFQKSDSASFQQRAFADQLAMQVIVDTYGLGIGLGSHKPNSLLLTLLSNTGIVGFVAFAAWVYVLLRPLRGPFGGETIEALRRAHRPFQWALIGLVLIHVFSNPNLSTLALWLQMGGLVGVQASLQRAVVSNRAAVSAWRNTIWRIRTAADPGRKMHSAGNPLAS